MYAEQFLNNSASGAACSSCISGQSQQLQDLENAIARVVVVVVLPDPFLRMGARINSAESQ